jgi:hypothetical protein
MVSTLSRTLSGCEKAYKVARHSSPVSARRAFFFVIVKKAGGFVSGSRLAGAQQTFDIQNVVTSEQGEHPPDKKQRGNDAEWRIRVA